jgi:hypothetical protein
MAIFQNLPLGMPATGNVGAKVVEPLADDIPKVFIEGAVPTDKVNKTEVRAELRYISKSDTFHAHIDIKLQGSSSLYYSKLNYTVKMYEDENRERKLKKSFKDWGHSSNKYVLKANFIDHSHARNIVCARLWDEVVSSRSDYNSMPNELRNSPRNGAVDGFPIKLYYNGTYQGVYTWNIGKDDWMWGMDEDNASHVLLCGETNDNGTFTEKAASFRALWSGTDGDNWSIEVGENSDSVKNSLNALISCVMNTTDDEFKAQIGTYLDIPATLDYFLFSYVTCGIDSLAKNMLLGTYDLVKWIPGQYDMDSTFGIHVDGKSFVSAERKCPEQYQEQFSLLWQRIKELYVDELKSRYDELRASVLSFSNIVTHFERFMDNIGSDLYAEDLTIYTDIPSGEKNDITQVRNFVRDRLAYVDKQFQGWDVVDGYSLMKGYALGNTLYATNYANTYSAFDLDGVVAHKLSNDVTNPEAYQNACPLEIPSGATSLRVISPNLGLYLEFYTLAEGATTYTVAKGRTRVSEREAGGVVYDLTDGDYQFVSVQFDGVVGVIPDDYDWTKTSIAFK